MSFASISDIHLDKNNTASIECFKRFICNPHVQRATHIGLLGDIFDLVAGNHEEYLIRWDLVFGWIKEQCHSGKMIYFAEGNHDMHLKRLFKSLVKNWSLDASHRLILIEKELVLELDGIRMVIGHGDEYNKDDHSYLRYKRMIKKAPFRILADYLMPLVVLDGIGEIASKESRKYGQARFNEEGIRQKVHQGIQASGYYDVKYIVGGHTHIEEVWDAGQFVYANNGYPPESGKFVLIDALGLRLEPL
jgi:UDP-2,3-diacylglucosamine hydrolase